MAAPALARRRRVFEGGAAVGELAVVEVLELALLDAELDPARRVVDDLPQSRERVPPLVVQLVPGQTISVDDVVLVVARGQRAVVLEHGLAAHPR